MIALQFRIEKVLRTVKDTLSTCLGLVLLGSIAAAAQEDAYFGVVTFEQRGNPFFGIYKNGSFISHQPEWSGDIKKYVKQILDFTARFPLKRQLYGLTADGRNVKVMIESVSEPKGDMDDTLFEVRTEPHARQNETVIFFWTPNVRVRELQPVIAQLDSESEKRLRLEAFELWKKAQVERPSEDRAKSIKFGQPVAQQVKGTADIVTIFLPALEDHGNGRTDDRASVFFIYHMQRRETIFGTFGHPEWSPNAKTVLGVKPLIYFKIDGDPNILFLAEHTRGWEDIGKYAIFDLRTGKALLKSF